MSKGGEAGRAVAFRMGLILAGVGALLFGLEIRAELTRLPATGSITHVWNLCRLTDTTVKHGLELMVACTEVAAQKRLHPNLDRMDLVPHAAVNFATKAGQQIRTAAALRNLYAPDAKPGQRMEILYDANEPKRISGHAHLADFLEFSAFIAIGAVLMALARWFKPGAGTAAAPLAPVAPAAEPSKAARQRLTALTQTRLAAAASARRIG